MEISAKDSPLRGSRRAAIRMVMEAMVQFQTRVQSRPDTLSPCGSAGVGESVIMRIGGWKTRSVFQRYDIVDNRNIAVTFGKSKATNAANPATEPIN
jgi:hypothetical protein